MGVIRSPANRMVGKMLEENACEVLSKVFGTQ